MVAGDEFDASKWMDPPELATWDLIVVYYGKQENYTCPLCAAVYRGRGPKWRLAYRFTLLEEWEQYRQQYKSERASSCGGPSFPPAVFPLRASCQ